MQGRSRIAAGRRGRSLQDVFRLGHHPDCAHDERVVVDPLADRIAVVITSYSIHYTKLYDAGADMIFAEALYDLADYKAFTSAVDVPVLANITEFGLTP